MGSLSLLWLILLILMVIVGGKKGLSSFFSLLVNFLILFVAVIFIAWGFNPLFIGILTSFLLLAIVIFWNGSDFSATLPAFKASVIVILLQLILIVLFTYLGVLGGFGLQDSDEIEGLSLLIGTSFRQIAIVVALISSIGAIGEAAVAISSGLQEITTQHPDISAEELKADGHEIGKEIIGTALNTLFFGFFGSSMGLFIWFYRLNYSFGDIINDKVFITELMAILVAVIGVVLIIPFTIQIIVKNWQTQKTS